MEFRETRFISVMLLPGKKRGKNIEASGEHIEARTTDKKERNRKIAKQISLLLLLLLYFTFLFLFFLFLHFYSALISHSYHLLYHVRWMFRSASMYCNINKDFLFNKYYHVELTLIKWITQIFKWDYYHTVLKRFPLIESISFGFIRFTVKLLFIC